MTNNLVLLPECNQIEPYQKLPDYFCLYKLCFWFIQMLESMHGLYLSVPLVLEALELIMAHCLRHEERFIVYSCMIQICF